MLHRVQSFRARPLFDRAGVCRRVFLKVDGESVLSAFTFGDFTNTFSLATSLMHTVTAPFAKNSSKSVGFCSCLFGLPVQYAEPERQVRALRDFARITCSALRIL